MTIEIRRFNSADAAAFDAVADDVFDHPIDRRRLAAYLAAPGHHFIGALADGRLIGQLAAVVHLHPDLRPTELYIDELAVAPSFQRQGIARRLIDAAFELARELGCAELWVATEPDNLPARGLYEARGARGEAATIFAYKL
jgi:ribosomal protein S18 acetylase RimI-like enzyme